MPSSMGDFVIRVSRPTLRLFSKSKRPKSPLPLAHTDVRRFLHIHSLRASRSIGKWDSDIELWKELGTSANRVDLKISYRDSARPINLTGDAKVRELNNTEMSLASGGIGIGSFIASYETWRLQVWVSNLVNGLPTHVPTMPKGTPLH